MRHLGVVCLAIATSVVGCGGCRDGQPPTPTKGATEPERAPAPTGSARDDRTVRPVPDPDGAWPHPRVLLSAARVAELTRVATPGNPAFVRLRGGCDRAVAKKIDPGFEAEAWAHAAADLALCALVTHEAGYAKAAVGYALALVDDAESVGDHKGGDDVVARLGGGSIGNRGVFAALVYDWLHDDAALDDAAKKKIVGRVYAYLTGYRKAGARNGDAASSLYMGHFATAAVAGPAFAGDDPRAGELRGIARKMWASEIVPTFAKKLAGGDFAEGWQYAKTVAPALSMHVDAESRAPGGTPGIADELPWLRETIVFQTHALHPSGGFMFDGGDWSRKPARPSAAPFWALSVAMPDLDAQRRALFLGRQAGEADDPLWHWLAFLADVPGKAADDPRKGVTSHFAKGTGTVLARTDWTKDATWATLSASPFYADHQHLDQGHFEVVRGRDRLLVDPSGHGSKATMSHNTLLIDDGGDNMPKAPNQYVYGALAGVARFDESARYVYGLATFGSAYDADPEDTSKDHSVVRAEREWFFSRGIGGGGAARLILYDRVTLAKPGYAVTWVAHAGDAPTISENKARIVVGSSSAQLTTLLPTASTFGVAREPSLTTDDPFMKNDPAEGVAGIRLETASPKGDVERRFLHTIVVGASAGAATATATALPELLSGSGADGARIDDEVYMFARSGAQNAAIKLDYVLPKAPGRPLTHYVVGLPPRAAFKVSAAPEGAGCKFFLTLVSGASASSNAAGILTLRSEACALR